MTLPSTATPLVAAIMFFHTAEAFSPSRSLPRTTRDSLAVEVTLVGCNTLQLRASEESDDSKEDGQVGLPPLPSEKNPPPKKDPDPIPTPLTIASVATKDVEVEQEDSTSYPINLPSPVLLSTSMLLAISSTGSLFEVLGGGPTKLGLGPTAALAAIGLPLSIFLIYAAILKGAAETEEDDREYNKPRKL